MCRGITYITLQHEIVLTTLIALNAYNIFIWIYEPPAFFFSGPIYLFQEEIEQLRQPYVDIQPTYCQQENMQTVISFDG
jgi:hypothetical protein